MKPDLCPFVCHSTGFHVISFEYLLRSQRRYHFIRLSHACSTARARVCPVCLIVTTVFLLALKMFRNVGLHVFLQLFSPFDLQQTGRLSKSFYNTVQPHQAICGPCRSYNGPQLNIPCCLLYHLLVMPVHQTNTLRRMLQMTNTSTNLSLRNTAPHVTTRQARHIACSCSGSVSFSPQVTSLWHGLSAYMKV